MITPGTAGVSGTSALDGLLQLVANPDAMKARLAELQGQIEAAEAAKAECAKARALLAAESEAIGRQRAELAVELEKMAAFKAAVAKLRAEFAI